MARETFHAFFRASEEVIADTPLFERICDDTFAESARIHLGGSPERTEALVVRDLITHTMLCLDRRGFSFDPRYPVVVLKGTAIRLAS